MRISKALWSSFSMLTKTVQPIAVVASPRNAPEDDFWGNVYSYLEFRDASYVEKLKGHTFINVMFYMNRIKSEKIVKGAKRPRNDPSLPLMGILAQRGKNRINQLGISCVELISFEQRRILVRGLDAINNTPIITASPFISSLEPDEESIKEPKWLNSVMKNYFKSKDSTPHIDLTIDDTYFNPITLKSIGEVTQKGHVTQLTINPEILDRDATLGLELFSHLYLVYESQQLLDVTIAQIQSVDGYNITIKPNNRIPYHTRIYDIKPYCTSFLTLPKTPKPSLQK